MKKICTILSILALMIFISSCKNEKSLQRYLVESQEKTDFIALDVPANFLQLKSNDVSDEVKKTLKSIKKINVTALAYKGNEATYEVEKSKLQNIFTHKDYKNLMTMKTKGMKVNLYYTGDADYIDEIIAFGYGKNAGVGVARLLGKNMNPAEIIEMMKNVKIDKNNINLNKFKTFFKKN